MEKLISSIEDRKYQIKQLQEITDEHRKRPDSGFGCRSRIQPDLNLKSGKPDFAGTGTGGFRVK